MENKKFKKFISLLLAAVLLVVPFSNTAMATSTKLEENKYIDGGGIFADLIIPNPDYTEQEILYPQGFNEALSTRSQTLANGVYRIKNAANGKYMDTNGGGTTAGTAIVQWDKSEYYGGTTTVNPNQLFKVTYIGTSGGAECYSIRPMTNNEMGVSAPKTTSVSVVDIQSMSVSEMTSNIYNYQEWIIASYGSYYTIANTYSATRYLATPSSSTNGLQMIMSSSITANAQWTFEAYSESIDRMAMVSFSDTLKIGDTFDFDAVMGSSTIGRNGGVTYSVQNTDGTATDKATINSSTGVLTALKEGTVQIVTTYTNAPWLWIWNVEIDYKYHLSLNTYYDRAFDVRYTNAAGLISDFSTNLEDIFGDVFYLGVYLESPVMINSTPDNCKLHRGLSMDFTTIYEICPANPSKTSPQCTYYTLNLASNGGECENCTSHYQIYRDFINQYPGSEDSASVLFTGNALYNDRGIMCNRSYRWYNNGLILQEIYANSNQYLTKMLSCFVHEVSHQIGGVDHYHEILSDGTCRGGTMCNECNPSSGRESWCIMDNGWRTDLLTCDKSEIYCSGCIGDIQSYLNNSNLGN